MFSEAPVQSTKNAKETWTDIATSIEMVVGKTNDEDEGKRSPRYSVRTALLSSHHCENFLRFLNKR